MFLQSLMKFHQLFFKILRKQNVRDTLSFVWSDNVKTVYPPTNTVCGGYINVKNAKHALFYSKIEVIIIHTYAATILYYIV